MTQKLPKGIRRNNPGNIEWGSPWQGLANPRDYPEDRFAAFVSPVAGIRALARTLITYYDKRKAADGSRIDSLQEIVDRWAPAADNNDVGSYARQLARLLPGIGPTDEVLNLHDPVQLRAVVEGIIRHENGRGPLRTANTWYADDVIDEALRQAGVVVKPKASATAAKAVPAVALGGVAVEQLSQVLPQVMDAVDSAKHDLTSGNWIQVALGGVMLGAALMLAWSQYRKHRDGLA